MASHPEADGRLAERAEPLGRGLRNRGVVVTVAVGRARVGRARVGRAVGRARARAVWRAAVGRAGGKAVRGATA
eukprot:CAMPEP_0182524924 /NCGR_PEP_ID=MMETSP1323-20130603/2131_1 /TAXON_ID=236787 /ORGANISM="Florenciella parvula, Strain RCC1693" /LENGTH=73 /DNA_ID=CAMNT_0024733571 /DNA_START=734 /DNA_END=952 /DNA_ORIENTATION=-